MVLRMIVGMVQVGCTIVGALCLLLFLFVLCEWMWQSITHPKLKRGPPYDNNI